MFTSIYLCVYLWVLMHAYVLFCVYFTICGCPSWVSKSLKDRVPVRISRSNTVVWAHVRLYPWGHVYPCSRRKNAIKYPSSGLPARHPGRGHPFPVYNVCSNWTAPKMNNLSVKRRCLALPTFWLLNLILAFAC